VLGTHRTCGAVAPRPSRAESLTATINTANTEWHLLSRQFLEA